MLRNTVLWVLLRCWGKKAADLSQQMVFASGFSPAVLRQRFFASGSSPAVPRQRFFASGSSPAVLRKRFFASGSSPAVLRQRFLDSGDLQRCFQRFFANSDSGSAPLVSLSGFSQVVLRQRSSPTAAAVFFSGSSPVVYGGAVWGAWRKKREKTNVFLQRSFKLIRKSWKTTTYLKKFSNHMNQIDDQRV